MYKDKEIAENRYRERRKKYTNVDTGIYDGDEFLEFTEVRIFGKMGVVLPVLFQDLSPGEAKKKYPSEERPQIIKSSGDGSVNFSFNFLRQKMEEDELEAAISDFVRTMKRLYPTNICLGMEKKKGVHLPYAAVDFTSTAINENLYNMVAIYPIEESLFMMLFNCPFEKRTEWSGCLPQIKERVIYYQEGETDESD